MNKHYLWLCSRTSVLQRQRSAKHEPVQDSPEKSSAACISPVQLFMDNCRQVGRAEKEKTKVINAFRHQRFLHTHLADGVTGTLSDQRLSASKISALITG